MDDVTYHGDYVLLARKTETLSNPNKVSGSITEKNSTITAA